MIIIRADANEKIGTGHVMRCLSIADAFSRKNKDVLFVTSDHTPDEMIRRRGYDSLCLDAVWDKINREDSVDIAEKYSPELLIADSYFVGDDYFKRLGGKVRTAYIDDLNFSPRGVEYLINYNVFARASDYPSYEGTKTELLLGPSYAPLRSEFQKVGEHAIKPVSDIFVSAGGSDPEMITERIMARICCRRKKTVFHFIVGGLNPRIEEINKLAREYKNAVLHVDEKHMAVVMKKCDMAVSASGSTLYELCACGVPTVTYTLADNQLMLADGFRKRGLALNAGDCRNNDAFIDGLVACIDSLAGDPDLRGDMSLRMQKSVDGYGADRLAETLLRP